MDINTGTRVGRMLNGLIETTNRRAKLVLTVDVAGAKAHHQDFRVKAWTGRDGTRMLTFDLADGDYDAGTYSTKVLHVNTTTGQASPARGYSDQLVLYMAKAALQYATTGTAPQPSNGSVRVQEADHCGCCGLQLTHPVSIELGIGPECAKRVGLEHHYGVSTKAATRRTKKAAATPAAVAPMNTDGALAEWEELYQDELGRMSAQGRHEARVAAACLLATGEAPGVPVGYEAAQPTEGSQDYAALTSAAIIELQRLEQRLERQQKAATAAGDHGLAQQLDDQLDECRGQRSGMQAELRAVVGVA